MLGGSRGKLSLFGGFGNEYTLCQLTILLRNMGLHPSWLGPFSPTRPQGPEAGWTVGHMFLDAQRALALGCTARYSWQCFWSRPEGPGRKVLSEEGDPPGDMPTAVGAASRAQDSQPQPLPHPCTDPKGTVASRMVGLLPEALDTQFLSIDGSLPGSPVPGILQARTLEWVATLASPRDEA